MWHFSPAASEVERRVIRWIAQFIGYPSEAGGCLLSGGSAGNLVGLAVARKQKAQFDAASLGMRGGPPVTVYVSQEGHASLEKSMVLLGMGCNQLRKIAVRDDFTIDLEALENQITEDRKNGYHPICVVGNAGTTNTGAVDPLDVLAEFCRKQDLWFHVDAAYGGPCGGDRSRRKTLSGIGSSRFAGGQPAQVAVRAGGGRVHFGPGTESAPTHLPGRGGLSAGREPRGSRRSARFQGLQSPASQELSGAEGVDDVQGVRRNEIARGH